MPLVQSSTQQIRNRNNGNNLKIIIFYIFANISSNKMFSSYNYTNKKKEQTKNKKRKPLKNWLVTMSIFHLIHAMKRKEINETQRIPCPSSETMVTQNLLFGQS